VEKKGRRNIETGKMSATMILLIGFRSIINWNQERRKIDGEGTQERKRMSQTICDIVVSDPGLGKKSRPGRAIWERQEGEKKGTRAHFPAAECAARSRIE